MVFTVNAANYSSINAAIAAAHNAVKNDANPDAVVQVTSNMTFSETLIGMSHVKLEITSGATLTLDTNLGVTPPAYDISNTEGAGLIGSGTFDINGNALYGVLGSASDNPKIGNINGTGANPDYLKIVGWKYGVVIESSATTAAKDVEITNLEVTEPNHDDVVYPIWVNSKSSVNGQWVDGMTIDGLLVDGGQPDAMNPGQKIGGAYEADNGFTADQVSIHGVHGGTMNNVVSLNGGEVGITVSRGSRDIVITNSHAEGADGHGFNIGSGTHAIDIAPADAIALRNADAANGSARLRVTVDRNNDGVVDAFGFLQDAFNDGRVWLEDIGGGRFQVGDTLLYDNGTPTTADDITTVISAMNRTENISMSNVSGLNNGINVENARDDNGELLQLADFYAQQADNVTLTDGTSESRDSSFADPSQLRLGITALSADITLGDFTYLQTFNDVPQSKPHVPITISADGTITFTDDSTVMGTTGDDNLLSGTNQTGDEIYAMAGDDKAIGRGGHDTLFGGDGNDTLNGGAGSDTLYGEAGNDSFFGETGNDTLVGGSGDDKLFGGFGDSTLGNSGADSLNGGAGNDTLTGEDGNDILEGGTGGDTLRGGQGDDSLYGDAGADTLDGGLGNDYIEGGDAADRITGDQGNDTILGGDSNDSISGGSGNDSIDGGAKSDRLFGDEGRDTINGGSGNDTIEGGISNDLLNGGANTDTIRGGDGNDTLIGEQGNDLLYGEVGSDSLSGGLNSDSLYGGGGNDRMAGGSSGDYLDGGINTDTLWGDDGNDILIGGQGNDRLYGGTGSDSINGGENSDTLEGGSGNDRLFGGTSGDTLNGGANTDTLMGEDGNDLLIGEQGNDSLDGGSGSDRLLGGDNADNLHGQVGNDTLSGDGGDDLLNGGDSSDTLYGGSGRDSLLGGSGNDELFGDTGNDTLDGGTNTDTLTGGSGNDRMTGGAGTDQFIFDDGWGDDVITDFSTVGNEAMNFVAVAGVDEMSDLTITRTGGNTLIEFGTDSILLEGFTATLRDGEFVF